MWCLTIIQHFKHIKIIMHSFAMTPQPRQQLEDETWGQDVCTLHKPSTVSLTVWKCLKKWGDRRQYCSQSPAPVPSIHRQQQGISHCTAQFHSQTRHVRLSIDHASRNINAQSPPYRSHCIIRAWGTLKPSNTQPSHAVSHIVYNGITSPEQVFCHHISTQTGNLTS
jgi:hypothetical protein